MSAHNALSGAESTKPGVLILNSIPTVIKAPGELVHEVLKVENRDRCNDAPRKRNSEQGLHDRVLRYLARAVQGISMR